jgi:hypothetical protein
MKILYMASIYGLVTEIKRNNLKKNSFTAVFTKKPLQMNFKKKIYSGFYEKTAAKIILQRFLR